MNWNSISTPLSSKWDERNFKAPFNAPISFLTGQFSISLRSEGVSRDIFSTLTCDVLGALSKTMSCFSSILSYRWYFTTLTNMSSSKVLLERDCELFILSFGLDQSTSKRLYLSFLFLLCRKWWIRSAPSHLLHACSTLWESIQAHRNFLISLFLLHQVIRWSSCRILF